jgi:hypothetical protein
MYGMFRNSLFNGDISKWNFHQDVDQSEESLSRLIELGKQYEEKRQLKMILGVSDEHHKKRISI